MILQFLFHTTHIQYSTEWYMNRQKTAQDEHKTLKPCMRFNQIFWSIYTIHYTGLLLLLKWCDISKDIRGLICFIRSSISQLRSPCFELSLSPHTESKQNEAVFAYSALTLSEALRVLGQRKMIKTLNIWAISEFLLSWPLLGSLDDIKE